MSETAKPVVELPKVTKTDVLSIPPEALVIITDPNHPSYDERVHLPSPGWLVSSIDEDGVLQPIKISAVGGQYIVIDGRQRVKAARIVNELRRERGEAPIKILCHPTRADDRAQVRLMVKMNEQRQDDDPLTRARKMNRLAGQGYSTEEIASHFAKSVSFVTQHLSLLDCTPEIQKAVLLGEMAVSAAVKLGTLNHEQQKEAVKELLGEETLAEVDKVDLEKLEEQIEHAGQAAAPKKKEKAKVSVKDVEKKLREVTGKPSIEPPSKKQIKRAALLCENLSGREGYSEARLTAIRWALEWVSTGSFSEADEESAAILEYITAQEE